MFVGYGHTVPLSYEGKVFAILYSLLGVPLAFIMFSAVVSRLMRPLAALLQLLKDKVGSIKPCSLYSTFAFLQMANSLNLRSSKSKLADI